MAVRTKAQLLAARRKAVGSEKFYEDLIDSTGVLDEQDAIEDVTITTDLTGVATGTDMTAAQAGQIEADLAALAGAVNDIIAALEANGVVAAE